MSYIVILLNLPPEIVTIDDATDETEGSPLGSHAEILALLTELFPDADFADPTWVSLDREEFSIEFMLGDERMFSLGLRIHGADSAIGLVQLLCECTGWRAYDTSTGELIDCADHPAQGLQARRE